MANSIETAVAYTGELEKALVQKSATGFFANNTLGAKFVGAKTIMIPDIDFVGLSNYNRETGFNNAPVSVKNTAYTMTMDRASSLQIDREDMDESGVVALAGKVLGEYIRTKVVPECDAYTISKLCKTALDNGNYFGADKLTTPYATFCEMAQKVRNAVGFDEEIVAFVDNDFYTALQTDETVSHTISIDNFKQGEVNLVVKKLNGVAIIPVRSELMVSDFIFSDDGGFKANSENTQRIHILMCPKNCGQFVKKSEKMRVFTPEQNTNADAYKFDYRIYYDFFIRKNYENSIFTLISRYINFDKCVTDITYEFGSEYKTIQCGCNITDFDNIVCSFKWYFCDEFGRNKTRIEDEYLQFDNYVVSSDKTIFPGTYYLICEAEFNEGITYSTDIIRLTITDSE